MRRCSARYWFPPPWPRKWVKGSPGTPYIPYTDRVDYLGGVMNNLAYLLAVEKLAGIRVPPRVEVIRVMLCELFRIASHVVWYGTFRPGSGANSRRYSICLPTGKKIFDIIEAICGARMHPNWFWYRRGSAGTCPTGLDKLVRDFVNYFPKKAPGI